MIVPDTIKSPSADDYVLGMTKRLGNRGLIRADLVYRDWSDFYSNRIRPNNSINIDGNLLDITEIGNYGDDVLERTYQALQSSFRYRVTDRLTTAATYTLSKLEGNIERRERQQRRRSRPTRRTIPSTRSRAGTYRRVISAPTSATSCGRGPSTT